nr:MAG TPA: hypothetical protein [Caudoviricetes sp.]
MLRNVAKSICISLAKNISNTPRPLGIVAVPRGLSQKQKVLVQHTFHIQ